MEKPPLSDRRGTPARSSSAWAVAVARLGFAARGVMYVGIGLAAAAVALGLAERPRSASGVMRLIVRQPLGEVMLAALAIGFVGYAAMSFVGAVQDPEEHGSGTEGIVTRIADALAGAIYVVLAASAVLLIAKPRRAGVDVVALAEHLLAMPMGAVWLGVIGVGLLGAGMFLLNKAYRSQFGARLERRDLAKRTRWWIVAAARAGTAARGVILVLCGVAAVRAAAERSPERVADVGDSLAALGEEAIGPWILGAMAVGFTAYGLYQLAKARYRRLRFR